MKGLHCIALILASAGLMACSGASSPAQKPHVQLTLLPQPTPTLGAPIAVASPTPSNVVVWVNGQPITREALEAEVQRARLALDEPPSPELLATLREAALEMLIEEVLLEQEAQRLGLAVSDQQVEEELAFARERAGGAEAFRAWLSGIGYSEQDIRRQIYLDLLANALRERVLAEMPRTAEYVHAAHILLDSEAEARRVLQQLRNGARFDALARTLSLDESTRAAGGDLGWFTRNGQTVLWAEVEEAAFALQPGEISEIVRSPVGYHIITVLARAVRPLDEADLVHMQQAALEAWMMRLRAQARVERVGE
ncbi:MAG: peptidylprolyl isomerase [Anaerolineae bacterium]|nr:peptidylprolyl isomerase [Thermoflexales bacterium]MDW8053142.1 peptidylprolyl isomerase [Anaerolineae bacterium]